MNTLTVAITSFLCILAVIHWSKPSVLYQPNGSLREFGVGFKKKTILPMWLVALLTAILCYGGAYVFT